MASERINLQRLPAKSADLPPDSTHPYGLCSRCGRLSNFTFIGTAPLTYDDHLFTQDRDGRRERVIDEQISILQCQGCSQNMVVVEEQYVGGRVRRDGFTGGGAIQWAGTFWWPAPGTTQS